VVEVYGTIDVVTDPNTNMLYNLEMENRMCYTVLTLNGYDVNQLKMHAPRVVTLKTLSTTKTQTFEQVQAIVDVNAAVKIIHETGGQHLNLDDFFKSRALLDRRLCIKELQDEKNAIAEKFSIRNEKGVLLHMI